LDYEKETENEAHVMQVLTVPNCPLEIGASKTETRASILGSEFPTIVTSIIVSFIRIDYLVVRKETSEIGGGRRRR
jgi:hypothetical protein